MRLETHQDPQTASQRLTNRSPASLAKFITSLAYDTGPIGEQVRTFILGDDLPATLLSLEGRIEALRLSSRHHSRQRGIDQEVDQRLNYIWDATETLVLPVSPETAFELLVLTIERDGDAMEQCGDDYFSIETAVKRAADLLAAATSAHTTYEVRTILQRLIAEDRSHDRRWLKKSSDLSTLRAKARRAPR